MVVLLCAGAVRSVVLPLMRFIERDGGPSVQCEFDTAGAIVRRVSEGAHADIVVVTAADISMLAEYGRLDQQSVCTIGSLGVGVAVRIGAQSPDIHDVDSFRHALLSARSIAHGSPARGGQSGIHVSKVLKQLDLDRRLGDRLRLCETSREAFEAVANGKVEMGLGQISEIFANSHLVFAGPFPSEVQSCVTFAAGVNAASKNKRASEEVLRYLASPAARERFHAAGFTVD